MPRIGLLADSHGRAVTTRRAVQRLLEQGVERLIHLGDVGTVEVIDELAVPADGSRGLIDAHLVFGNTDWDLDALWAYAEHLGIHVDHPVGRLDLGDGRQLVFCHGHDPQAIQAAVASGARYVCHGHTHRSLDTRRGRSRLINPGALFRAQRYTAAVLDTDADSVEFLDVGRMD